MKIHTINNTNFNARIKTASILETTTGKAFENNGIEGMKEVFLALNKKPMKAPGSRGYRYYAKELGNKIIEKYPQIKEATEEINSIINKNPHIKKQDLRTKVKPYIDKLGKEIDIEV